MDTGALSDQERPVTEAAVGDLVQRFYDRVRADDRLGPIFAAVITDWDRHLEVFRDFWSAVLLRTDRYRGCVMSPHFGLTLEPGDFDRWLALFRPSAHEALPAQAAERAIIVAEAISDRVRRAFAGRAGQAAD